MVKHPKLNYPRKTTVKVRFSNFSGGINTTIDENLLPVSYSKISYNTNFNDRALKNGIGFKTLTLPTQDSLEQTRTLNYLSSFGNIDGMWIFNCYDETNNRYSPLILVHAEDNHLYYQALYANTEYFGYYQNFEYVGKPTVIVHKQNDQDVAVLASENDSLAIWNGVGSPAKIDKTLSLTSLCVHYERLFATVGGAKNMVRFSDEFDLTEWNESPTEGGFIELVDERGTCNKVISFNDYVYIIREHGISRLSAYGDQNSYSITHLFLSTDRIFDNTAVLCGDRIIMLCSDGLYSFNGYSASKYPLKINALFDFSKIKNAVACYYNGKYYLACCLDFGDNKQVGCESASYHNNALLEFDPKTGDYNIVRGVDIIHLTPIVDENIHKLAVVFGDDDHRKTLGEITNDGSFFGTPLLKNWTSPLTDLGYPDKLKVIKEVHLLSKYDITLHIVTEMQERTYLIKGSNAITKICPNIKGHLVSLIFESSADDFYVSNPTVIADLI